MCVCVYVHDRTADDPCFDFDYDKCVTPTCASVVDDAGMLVNRSCVAPTKPHEATCSINITTGEAGECLYAEWDVPRDACYNVNCTLDQIPDLYKTSCYGYNFLTQD